MSEANDEELSVYRCKNCHAPVATASSTKLVMGGNVFRKHTVWECYNCGENVHWKPKVEIVQKTT